MRENIGSCIFMLNLTKIDIKWMINRTEQDIQAGGPQSNE